MKKRLVASWGTLNARERLTIISGVTLLGAVAFYLYAWEPMRKVTASLRENLPAVRKKSEWMRVKKQEAEKLKSAVETASKAGKEVEAFTIKAFEGSGAMDLTIKTLEKDKVSVVVGSIEPKKLFAIIGKLRKEGLITVSAMRIEGLADGQSVLAEGVFVRFKESGA
jgi:type II secretory pathway component PulM